MNSGCAVICNKNAGATKYLIKNNCNGFIYNKGGQKGINRFVESLISDKKKIIDVGFEAYKTIHDLWNSTVAAHRFVEICKCLLKKHAVPNYINGPLSKA